MLVICTVALTIPVAFYAFHQIESSSNKAASAAHTLEEVGSLQQEIGDLRVKARDYTIDQTPADRIGLANDLNALTDNARSISRLDVPPVERAGWARIFQQAGVAVQTLKTNVAAGRGDAAVTTFDAQMKTRVQQPADSLTGVVRNRGKNAQTAITHRIEVSAALLLMVLACAVLLATILAVVIPRGLMRRIDDLGRAAHGLARGNLSVRVVARGDDEIAQLAEDFNLMARALEHRQQENQTLQQQLQLSLLSEQERATRDPLTSLRNHRYFQESLSAEIDRCSRTGSQVSIAIIDLDNFKQVNDRFGHHEGDAVLLRTTKAISDNLRPYDLACRLGGEEFGVIFPETSAEDAKNVLDRIAAIVVSCGANGERQTFSAGVTTYPVHSTEQTELYQRADEAAYTAKGNGKAQTVIFDPAHVVAMDSAERIRQRSREAVLSTATTLVSAVDQKDPYTRHHAELTAIYAATLARALQLDEETVKLVYRTGLLHDVGKIGVNEQILQKAGRLTTEEYEEVKQHPEFSYRILETGDLEPIATWVRHHHEHWNGSGYPNGLEGPSIPLGSRIVLIADAFEAMTSDRVYRRALTIDQAVAELTENAGSQFDPDMVPVMVHLIAQGVFTSVMEKYGREAAGRLQPAIPMQGQAVQQIEPPAAEIEGQQAA